MPRKRRQQQAQGDDADWRLWPGLQQQIAMDAGREAEAAAASTRAAVLVSRGWGPLAEWLGWPDPHPGERWQGEDQGELL